MRLTWILSASILYLGAAAAGPPESATAAQDARQAILSQGWNTTPAEAAKLESQPASRPQDVATRTRLISYYYQQMIAEPRARHVLWLIENHPGAAIFRFAPDLASFDAPWNGLNNAAYRDKSRALWRRQLERAPNDTSVLANAAQALPIEESLRLLRRLRTLEPSNPVWTVNLARLYAWAVRGVFYGSNPTAPRAMGSPRPGRYRDLWTMRLPVAGPDLAAKLKAELETSSDAALVGITGELLVDELAILGEQDLKSDARKLLARARRLDPKNPEWQQ